MFGIGCSPLRWEGKIAMHCEIVLCCYMDLVTDSAVSRAHSHMPRTCTTMHTNDAARTF